MRLNLPNILGALSGLVFIPLFLVSSGVANSITVMVPSEPILELPNQAKKTPSPPEVDMLIALMDTFTYTGKSMEMPQIFAAYIHDRESQGTPRRLDLLGDIEEIRYLDQKAWGVNVGVEPGLYQFVMETKPWWDEKNGRFEQEQVKVILPALDMVDGWDAPVGISLEILPLTRPFGLTAPAIFNGKVLIDGEPRAKVPVYMGYINSVKNSARTKWHRELEARSDAQGQFSFVLNQPGWWYCKASIDGNPLKGSDGLPKQMVKSAVLWLYVDAPEKVKR